MTSIHSFHMITNVSLTSYDEIYNQEYFDCEFKTEFTQIYIRYWMYKKEIYGITYIILWFLKE